MTTANKITLIRVGMIPFFIYFAYQGTQTCDIIALCIFLLASMTDALALQSDYRFRQIGRPSGR